MTDNVKAALWYASHGWYVMPLHTPIGRGRQAICSCTVGAACVSIGKHPRTAHAYKDASIDEAQIKDWWRQWPDANVGIATGLISGVVVLDIDPKNGGLNTLDELLAEHGPLPKTPTVRTGSGGYHYYFECSEDMRGRKLQGIDIKADGGLVVAPPSLHYLGRQYEWERGPDKRLALPPDWMLVKRKSSNGRIMPDDGGPILEGSRNETLFRIASSLRRNGMDQETIFAMLIALNDARVRPPLDLPELELIANSAAGRYEPEVKTGEAPPELTDLGNSRRFAATHGENARHTEEMGWLIWDGARWARDRTKEVRRLAINTVEAIAQEANGLNPNDETEAKEIEAIRRWSRTSQSAQRISSLLTVAESHRDIADVAEHFDTDIWLFNCNNGTLDLRTGQFREHRRNDYITKLAPVDYDSEADCPNFKRFVSEIMAGHQTLVDYLQRLFGYTLTGSVREGILPIFWGQGSNGKTTLLNAIQDVLGPDYSGAAPPNLLINRHNDPHPTELVDLKGKRLVIAAESGEGKQLAIELIKQLTGSDKIKGRYMRQDFIEFYATHKIVLMTNFKPAIRNVEFATWRRIKLVPFTRIFKEDERDLELGLKLKDEASGILNWMLEGCRRWQADGLVDPPEIKEATESYKQDSDILADFLSECCILKPGAITASKALHSTYEDWAKKNGQARPMSHNLFSRRLEQHSELVRVQHKNAKSWKGIRLRAANIEVQR